MAGTVTFRRDRCKGCELCTLVCPKPVSYTHLTLPTKA